MPYQRYLHEGLAGLTDAHDLPIKKRVWALWSNLPPAERPQDKEPLWLGFRGGKVTAVGCKSGDSYTWVHGVTWRFRPLDGGLIEATGWRSGCLLRTKEVKDA